MHICIHIYIYITYTCKIHIYVVLVKSGDGVMAMHNMICVIDIMCKYCKSVYAVYIYICLFKCCLCLLSYTQGSQEWKIIHIETSGFSSIK